MKTTVHHQWAIHSSGLASRRFGFTQARKTPWKGWFLLIACSLIIGILWGITSTKSAQGSDALQTILVQPGDSLWSLAAIHAGKMDPWDWISETKKLNHLSSNNLTAGVHLKVHSSLN